jgi:hypothetical protein
VIPLGRLPASSHTAGGPGDQRPQRTILTGRCCSDPPTRPVRFAPEERDYACQLLGLEPMQAAVVAGLASRTEGQLDHAAHAHDARVLRQGVCELPLRPLRGGAAP